MTNDTFHSASPMGENERRSGEQPANRMLGRVIACDGSRATIAAETEAGTTDVSQLWSVGRLISIEMGTSRVAALVFAMRTSEEFWAADRPNRLLIDVEMVGEVYRTEDGSERFSTGISRYPYLGAVAHRIRTTDLAKIFDSSRRDACVIGKLTQDDSINAAINIPQILSKHFAVVGSTGVGKTTAVSLLLNKAIETDPKLRVLILDPHNEFAAAFPDHSVVIDTDTLDLPFWLMRLEEFAEVIFRGRKPVPEEMDFLRDLIPEAKKAFRGSDGSAFRRTSDKSAITPDTPVPYRIADLLALIDERIGRLEGRGEKPALRSLKGRILSAINDPRYNFMFSSNTISDTILETVAHIFRIPGDGKPISVFQLSGIPSEVVNSVVSVLCRMSFELAVLARGSLHMLVVCEEAHRYVPADPERGFFPTRQSIAQIAKEGRKYGISLGVISQRPSELDQTILSQCSTVFAMRLSNEIDQKIILSAVPNASTSTTSFLSSIGNGEAIAFGEAVSVPMRMRFDRVPTAKLPKASGAVSHAPNDTPDTVDLNSIVTRMRATTKPVISGFQQSFEASFPDLPEPAPALQQPPDVSRWKQELGATAGAHEPYRPDMLPGRTVAPPTGPSTTDLASTAVNELRKASLQMQAQNGPPPTESRPSLRDSLLKKPLGSLYRKD
ncbi:ATP-binding protein [uncultured Agrobacterium sp.]|uniref:ATP-binding protein n=1 Tax=uncultured Agrobacterium sp. TaxID=157277 RepID=UPI0026001443|nr:ATP-binding protein [uncultured Agrobacterium sp.]